MTPTGAPDDEAAGGSATDEDLSPTGRVEPATAADLHAARQRVTRRILLAGSGLAVAATIGMAVAGGSGQAGMVVLLLVLALTSGAAGLWSTVTLLVDDLRKRGTTRGRIVTAVGLFVSTGMLMAMVVGAGAT